MDTCLSTCPFLAPTNTRVIKKLTAHVCCSPCSYSFSLSQCVCAGLLHVCVCVAIEFCQVRHEKGLCKVRSEKETDKPHTYLITRILGRTYTCIFDSDELRVRRHSLSPYICPSFFALLLPSSHITRHLRPTVLCIQNRQGNNNNSLATASAMCTCECMHGCIGTCIFTRVRTCLCVCMYMQQPAVSFLCTFCPPAMGRREGRGFELCLDFVRRVQGGRAVIAWCFRNRELKLKALEWYTLQLIIFPCEESASDAD